MKLIIATTLLYSILAFLFVGAAYVLFINVFEPNHKRQLRKCCEKNKITKEEFEAKVYDELPKEVKIPVKFSCHVEKCDGSAQVKSHSVTLSYYYVIEHLENKYQSVLDNKALCLTLGHERIHVLYPNSQRWLWLFSKKYSIKQILCEVRADVEGRRAFEIPQEEAFKILKEEAKKSGQDKDSHHIFRRCEHPDWSDRCIYVRDYARYDKELEERVKRDYCKKLRCSYDKVADLTIIE